MAGANRDGLERRSLVLVSEHRWFADALRAVLEPEGFSIHRVGGGSQALRDTAAANPDLVIIDERLPDIEAPELCARLCAGPLAASVPILVYSAHYGREESQAEALLSGAWGVIREPIRSRLLVAKLQRLLEIKAALDAAQQDRLADPETGLLNLKGLTHSLDALTALARRLGQSLSCVAVGPTEVGVGAGAAEQWRATADVCLANTRVSDVRGWVSSADVAVIAFDAHPDGAVRIVSRLNKAAAGIEGFVGDTPMSGGIVEVPIRLGTGGRPPVTSLSCLLSAQSALAEARESGGGVHIVNGA